MSNNDLEFVLLNSLGPKIDTALKNKSNINKLIRYIRSYADKHAELLLSTDMSRRLLHSTEDKNIIYQITDISEKEVKEQIKNAKSIYQGLKDATNPFYILGLLIARWFKINKMDNETIAMMIYIGYPLYSSSHTNSFRYLPNKQIMDYTINNLSNRFEIKKYGTIQGTIEHTIGNAITGRYLEELIRGADIDLKDIIVGLHTRMRSWITNIAEKFYDNHKKGNYLFHEDEDLSEENFHLSDNISFKIDRVVQTVNSAIISEGFDYNTCIMRAVRLNSGCSAKKLQSMLNTIIEEDMESIRGMISDILTLYIYKGTGNRVEEVGSLKFSTESLKIYKSNAQDEVTTRVKERLLNWIHITSKKYGRNFISMGKTSLDTYRRAIYTAFIFKIMESVK